MSDTIKIAAWLGGLVKAAAFDAQMYLAPGVGGAAVGSVAGMGTAMVQRALERKGKRRPLHKDLVSGALKGGLIGAGAGLAYAKGSSDAFDGAQDVVLKAFRGATGTAGGFDMGKAVDKLKAGPSAGSYDKIGGKIQEAGKGMASSYEQKADAVREKILNWFTTD